MSRFRLWQRLLCLLLALPLPVRAEGPLASFFCVVQSVESASGFSCQRHRSLPGSDYGLPSSVRVSLLGYQPPPDNHPLAAQAHTALGNILLYQQVRVDVFAVDKHGRDLGRVRLYKADVTEALLRRGLGRVDRAQFGAYYYVPFEREAQSQGKGIWSSPRRSRL
ncbi:thermonuclease family protein [Vogesella facilis]|uniref:Thermonuclease family protein n=1 Tax=Vogesella facilis TaxID=1655232 RepID=A0ABV7REY5_9NEIS